LLEIQCHYPILPAMRFLEHLYQFYMQNEQNASLTRKFSRIVKLCFEPQFSQRRVIL
jgi:hypothetical protein